ncbi:MAG: hemerythrin family protein [Candidatus Yanofskybacteria bacterium]|nr:hemerythrin family protein [Candidatus Yanofskybacteria bacterium]
MQKFIWKEEYSVGVASIDEQHKNFFRITNDLIDFVERPDAKHEDCIAIARELEHYAAYHLTTEEKYFHELAYPHAEEHIREHDYYRDKVQGLLSRLQDDQSVMKSTAEELANFSISWLSNHILLSDKKYSVFFERHGVH